MKSLTLIAAIGRNRELGRAGRLIWRFPEDLKAFKARTMGHVVIVGRKTYEEIGRPLPGRRLLVVGKTDFPGTERFASPLEALARAFELDSNPFVAGGAAVYQALIVHADRLELTHIDDSAPDADVFFPAYDGFEEVSRRAGETLGLRFSTYLRTGSPRP